MPAGWTKTTDKNGKACFMNEKKEISYIDPRDQFWKKKTWAEIPVSEVNETPYGWERVVDDVLGVYYIDHINNRNVFGDPRTEAEDQEKIKEKLTQELEMLRAQKDELEKDIKKKAAEIDDDEEKLKKKEKKYKEEVAKGKSKEDKEKEKEKEKEKKRKKKQKKKKKEIEEKKVELDIKQYESTTLKRQIEDMENLTKNMMQKREEEVEKQKQMQMDIIKLKQRLQQEIDLTEKAFKELESLREVFVAKIQERNDAVQAEVDQKEMEELEVERQRLEQERKGADEAEMRQELLNMWKEKRRQEREEEEQSDPESSYPGTPNTPVPPPPAGQAKSEIKAKPSNLGLTVPKIGARGNKNLDDPNSATSSPMIDKLAILNSDLQRRMELARLQRQIEQAEEERKIIEKLKAKMAVEKALVDSEDNEDRTDPKKIPDWVKQINQNATYTKTLRLKMKSDPDMLNFKQKAFLFTGQN